MLGKTDRNVWYANLTHENSNMLKVITVKMKKTVTINRSIWTKQDDCRNSRPYLLTND